MSFENRDYAKRDSYPDQGWTRAVKWLVIANIAFFLGTFLATRASPEIGPREIYGALGLVPGELVHRLRLWQLLTYAFVHDLANPFHLIINMYILWVAGRGLEFIYGIRRFVTFYFLAALFSAVVYLGLALMIPECRGLPLYGASGAVMAVLVVYASYHPGDRILLFLLFDVPIWIGVAAMVGIDLMVVSHASEGGGVAAGCHVAGAAFGFVFHHFRDRIETLLERVPARVPAVRINVRPASSAAAPPAGSTSSALEAELDQVLKKIHEKGMGDLTDDEKGVLDRASKHYRGKR
jgi:membrane associated rhomboid family serine protease